MVSLHYGKLIFFCPKSRIINIKQQRTELVTKHGCCSAPRVPRPPVKDAVRPVGAPARLRTSILSPRHTGAGPTAGVAAGERSPGSEGTGKTGVWFFLRASCRFSWHLKAYAGTCTHYSPRKIKQLLSKLSTRANSMGASRTQRNSFGAERAGGASKFHQKTRDVTSG